MASSTDGALRALVSVSGVINFLLEQLRIMCVGLSVLAEK